VTSRTPNPASQLHIPEEPNPLKHRCNDPNPRKNIKHLLNHYKLLKLTEWRRSLSNYDSEDWVNVVSGQNYTQEAGEIPHADRNAIRQFRQPDTGKVPHEYSCQVYFSFVLIQLLFSWKEKFPPEALSNRKTFQWKGIKSKSKTSLIFKTTIRNTVIWLCKKSDNWVIGMMF